jgi:hypothetical protein
MNRKQGSHSLSLRIVPFIRYCVLAQSYHQSNTRLPFFELCALLHSFVTAFWLSQSLITVVMALLKTLVALVAAASAMPAPQTSPSSPTRAACAGNTASDRSVWCGYSIDTNWYEEAPDTGVTVEVSTIVVLLLARAHTDDSSIG